MVQGQNVVVVLGACFSLLFLSFCMWLYTTGLTQVRKYDPHTIATHLCVRVPVTLTPA